MKQKENQNYAGSSALIALMEFNVRGCVYQKLDFRSPRRDTALFCGFCNLQIQNRYLPGM